MATPGWTHVSYIHSSFTNVSVFAIKQYVLLVTFLMKCYSYKGLAYFLLTVRIIGVFYDP